MKGIIAVVLSLTPAAWAGPKDPQFVYQGAAEIAKTGFAVAPIVDAKETVPDELQDRLAKAKEEMTKLIAVLEKSANDEALSDRARLEHFKALAIAKKALAEVDALIANASAKPELEARIAEARLFMKIAAGYLGEKGTFNYYKLKEGPLTIDVGADAAYERISRKLPFLGVIIGGNIRINPQGQIRTQFNALKAEFYGVLLEAAHLDKTDKRLKGIAKWANDTEVLEADNFHHEAIITTRQLWDLELP